MKQTLPGWARPRVDRAALQFDLALAAVLALTATTTSLLYARAGIYDEVAPTWLWVLGIAMATLPLAVRRVWPVPVAIVVSVAFFVCGQFAVPELLIINITLFIALYTVGAWETRRQLAFWARFGVSVVMVVWLIVTLIIASSDTETIPGISRSGLFSAFATYAVIQIITNLLYFGGAFYFGNRSWQAARLKTQLEAQGRELDIERRISAEQAVALDRMNIARELHDVVAHHVSVMGIQAAAARRLLAQVERAEAERAQADPDQAEPTLASSQQATAAPTSTSLARAAGALDVVETSAEQAIIELRGLLETLRSPESTSAATALGIAQLTALVTSSTEAGTPATLIVAGTPRPVPMLVDVALYRTAQEALTNVRKHAGRGAEATVRLRFEADAVEIEVGDTGIAQRLTQRPGHDIAAPSGSGLGLRGMRERVGAVGGTVEAGRRENGGFMVRARIPLAVPAQASDPAQVSDPARSLPQMQGPDHIQPEAAAQPGADDRGATSLNSDPILQKDRT